MRKGIITKNLQTFLLIASATLIVPLFSFCNFEQKVYGHDFAPNESASVLSFANQLQVESELVKINLMNNNLSLAQNHANKAAALLTPNIVVEIAEKNQKTADDLTIAVNDLQKISSSSKKQRQMVNQLVSRINSTLGEAVKIRLEGQGSCQ